MKPLARVMLLWKTLLSSGKVKALPGSSNWPQMIQNLISYEIVILEEFDKPIDKIVSCNTKNSGFEAHIPSIYS